MPQLQLTNATKIPSFQGVSHLSKEEFVEYARGSFRLMVIVGGWTSCFLLALVFSTKMVVSRRLGDGAEFARERKAGASDSSSGIVNPMLLAVKGVEATADAALSVAGAAAETVATVADTATDAVATVATAPVEQLVGGQD